MIQKIVFFLAWPFMLRDWERFGIEILKGNGFQLAFFDFSPFIYPAASRSFNNYMPETDYYYRFNTLKDARKKISELDKESFVILLEKYQRNTYEIYKAISEKGIPYAIFVANAVPETPVNIRGPENFLRKIAMLVKSKRLLSFVYNLPFRVGFSSYLGVKEPRLWLAGGEKSVENYLNRYPFGNESEILWSHSLDYNIYLENVSESAGGDGSNALYLDVGVPQFPGDDTTGRRKEALSKEKYYPSICRFFDRVEQEQNIKIKIAAHPRAPHQDYPEYFCRRHTVRNNTCQEVSRAKFIITHNSTAVGFAVLYNKPVIFITTNELEQNINDEGNSIKTISGWLNKTPINIDKQFTIDWHKELSVNKDVYANFKHCFIKKNGTPEINSWQILSNRLKTLNQ